MRDILPTYRGTHPGPRHQYPAGLGGGAARDMAIGRCLVLPQQLRIALGVNLGPTDVTNCADETGGIVKTSHRLILFGTESPHIATLSKVMWARGIEVLVHRVGGVGRWKTVVINASARMPFRRRGHDFGEVCPIPVFPSMSLGIDKWMCDCCMAVGRDLDHR